MWQTRQRGAEPSRFAVARWLTETVPTVQDRALQQRLKKTPRKRWKTLRLARPNLRHMPHLAAGAGRALAVKMEVSVRVVEDRAPAPGVVADEVRHPDAAPAGGRSERPAADGAHVLLELRRDRALDGPMAGVMHPRRNLVDDDPLGAVLAHHKHLDR